MDPTPLLRHLIASIGYRASRALLDAPKEFGTFEPGAGAGSPLRVLAHVNAVLGAAHARLVGIEVVQTDAADWRTELDRTFVLLERIDAAVADGRASADSQWMPLLQGPLTDVLTHIGQLAMLRRLAGRPVATGSSYALAPIEIGRVRYA
ncbi:MAG: hypothetical protein IPH13_05350 [Planctomycetes bacterium]|nr:hypothetical protein [Planctomycetota bacterium]MCC7172041.1 hypothetical protein [Planctomycetota bacterium]